MQTAISFGATARLSWGRKAVTLSSLGRATSAARCGTLDQESQDVGRAQETVAAVTTNNDGTRRAVQKMKQQPAETSGDPQTETLETTVGQANQGQHLYPASKSCVGTLLA